MNKLLLFCLLISTAAIAQTDTVYYNDQHIRSAIDSAVSFSVTRKINDTSYFVAHYELNPTRLSSTNYYKSIEPPVYHGEAVEYYKNGDTVNGWYNMNQYTGEKRDYYSNGDILRCTYYQKDGKLHGTLVSYYTDGKVKRRARYAFDKLVQGHQYDENGDETSFTPYMVMPEPNYNIEKFLARNVKYPPTARRSHTEGRVIVQFIVGKDGKIKDIQIVSKDTPEILNDEVRRLVNKMKPWQPGILDDEPIDVYFTLPILFKLD